MPKVCPVCNASYTDASIFCPADGSSLRAAELEGDLIGAVVADRYLVTDLLGEGGMGKVYLARHVRLPQQAAIKVLRPAMLRDPAAVARFNREAANASRIEHERIARVFDYGESADGTVYLAMEYVPGRTLKKLLATDGAQPAGRTAVLTRQIADALDAAHRLGIVHRDLKPDNVMVIEDPDTGDRCKVVDFGIAKAVGGDAGDAGLTKTGFVVGTPEFMSPEQLLGGEIDHRSDVYALALVSFQCLTGALPFDTTTPERAMTARLIEAPQPLAGVKPDIGWPAEVQAVFDRGLARDPAQRYESAGAFARDLEVAVHLWTSGTPTAQQQDTFGAATSITNAPAPVGGTAAAGTAGTPAARETRRTTAPRPMVSTPTHGPRRGPLLIGGAVVGVAAVAVAAFLMLQGGGPEGSAPTAVTTDAPPAVTDAGPATPATDPPPLVADAGVGAGTGEATPTGPGEASGAPNPPAQSAPRSTQDKASITPNTPADRSTPPSAPSSARETPEAARFTLDSIRIALDPEKATEADARRGVAALRMLMPRLTTAEDSAWAYLRQAEGHLLMEDARSACVALQTARPLVRTSGQREVLANLSGMC